MKALTVLSTLVAALALSACGRPDEGGPAQGGAAATTEQRVGESSNATVDNTRDAAGTAATTSGSTSNTPPDAAPSMPGRQDAVVTGTPEPGRALDRAGEQARDAVGSTGQAAERAGQATENAVERAGDVAQNAGERATDAAARATDAATDAVSDAAITASVNAELARDNELSALGINVDTDNARVTLRGTAPNQAALERATQLAQKVRGVNGVDNELTVQSR